MAKIQIKRLTLMQALRDWWDGLWGERYVDIESGADLLKLITRKNNVYSRERVKEGYGITNYLELKKKFIK